jgi:hypothetical protein
MMCEGDDPDDPRFEEVDNAEWQPLDEDPPYVDLTWDAGYMLS